MDTVLNILRDERAAIVFSIILGISIVVVFADYCVSRCLVSRAPKFEQAPRFSAEIGGRGYELIPILSRHQHKPELFVEF